MRWHGPYCGYVPVTKHNSIVLTIADSDSRGGAGEQAAIKAAYTVPIGQGRAPVHPFHGHWI